MISPARPHRLFGFGRAAKAPVVQDAADLGTAFGMEVTLDQADEEPLTAVGPAAARSGWISRLAGRREPK